MNPSRRKAKLTVPEKILELVEKFDLNLNKYKKGSNEAEVRNWFIDPLFEALGWDVRNQSNKSPDQTDVRLEDTLESGKRPDYSFWINGERKFFVDAKDPSVNIEGGINPAFQVKRYGWSNKKMPLVIVTDFEEFAIYDCRTEPFKNDRPEKSRFKIIKYYEFEKRWDEIASLFSKEAVQKGSLESIPTPPGKKVDEALLEDISEWRKALAVNIAKMNPSLDQKSLNHAVQMTIDRILFLRICEDRSIEEDGRLKKLFDGDNVYSRLFKLFEEADKRYNSGLFHFHAEKDRDNFDTITPSIQIEDKVLKGIIKGLYYPDSPYVFSEIPAEILGQVYEQFLGKVIQLDENRKVDIEFKPEVQKAGGVYYTPSYIVEYIVKNTVGKLLEGKSPKEASELHILDPACGSGSFLIGAYQYLLDWHLDWYKCNLVSLKDAGYKDTSNEIQRLLPAPIEKPGKNAKAKSKRIWERASVATLPIEPRSDGWHLRTAERKRILLNNIYGVDIDTQAVEVTKLSLLLKVLEGENKATIADLTMYSDERALPDLGNNIKCGNSLIEWDIQQDRPDLTDEELWRINPFDWKKKGFPKVFARGGFDAVIGNPPYVRYGLLTDLKNYLKNHYQVYHALADLYSYFIERGISLLNDTGIFSYIVANKWTRTNYGEPLRRWLKNQCIDEIIDFGDLPIFKNATTYPCILRVSKGCTNQYIKAVQVGSMNFGDLSKYVEEHNYRINRLGLRDESWPLVDESMQNLLDKLRTKGIPLIEYINGKVYLGVLTGLDKAFIINEKTKNELIEKDSKSKDLIKPFLKGRDVKRYQSIEPNKYVILIPSGWTRKMAGEGINAFDWLKDNYPAVADYFVPFADGAKKRDKSNRGENWWELRACDYYDEFEKSKILWPEIAGSARFTYDETRAYTNHKVYLIPNANLYLLGILNSSLIRLFIHSVCTDLQGNSYNFSVAFVGRTPIYIIDFSNPRDVEIHNKMVPLVEKMLDLHKRLDFSMTEHEKTMLSQQIEFTDHQIDTLVYELYGLTEEEIKIVEDKYV